MNYVNCTPLALNTNDGRTFPTSGNLAIVSASFTAFDSNGVCRQAFGDVSGLPDPQPDTLYIVSAMVLGALAGSRSDVVAPATGHPDCVRNDKGHIISVPGFVQ